MKNLIIISLFIMLLFSYCSKNPPCTKVTITRHGTICSTWGIQVNGQVYPSNDIPSSYQQEGLEVCVKYELYEDMRLCPCCGGTWAKINSIRLPPE